MTRDDLIRMAREAGGSNDDPSNLLTISNLERFAALVAAAERDSARQKIHALRCEIERDETLMLKAMEAWMAESGRIAIYASEVHKAITALRERLGE